MRIRLGLIGSLVFGIACGGGGTAPSSTSTSSTPVAAPSVPVSALVTIAESATIEQQGTGQTGTSNNYLGQSITIPGAGSYNNLRFNWDGYTSVSPTAPATRGPVAVGDLFILTQEYLGLPANLGTATAGFLARAERVEQSQYVFAPSVTLKSGTKYWFYMYYAPGSARFNPVTGFSEDAYAGGDMYIAPELGGGFSPLPFRKAAASLRVISFGPPIVYYTPPPGTYVDANFKLIGAPAGQ
jgi:hypothetical protein